jgi:hypothetical protein
MVTCLGNPGFLVPGYVSPSVEETETDDRQPTQYADSHSGEVKLDFTSSCSAYHVKCIPRRPTPPDSGDQTPIPAQLRPGGPT